MNPAPVRSRFLASSLRPAVVAATIFIAMSAALAQTSTEPTVAGHVADGQTAAAQAELLTNARLEAVTEGKLQSWGAYEGGYELAAGAGPKGRNAALLQRGAAADPARGISQNVTLEQKAAANLIVSGWSRAENVSGIADSDYSLYADLTYDDGTNEWGLYAAMPTGTHDWQQIRFVVKPAKPIKSLTFYGLFRSHTGKAWFADFSLTTEAAAVGAAPAARLNLLTNSLFANLSAGKPAEWYPFDGGFETAIAAGRDGVNAVTMERGPNEPHGRGISQNVKFRQAAPAPIVISGYSKAENVSGTSDNDYSVYVDLAYADGTSGWGFYAPFETGTHDWQYAEATIKPEKPVKSLTVYALFRRHTGKVWFSNLSVSAENLEPAEKPVEKAGEAAPRTAHHSLKLIPVIAEKTFVSRPWRASISPTNAVMQLAGSELPNLLKNPALHADANGDATSWQAWGQGYRLQPAAGRNHAHAIFLQRKAGEGERGIMQEIPLNQKTAAPLRLSGYSQAVNVDGAPDSDYSLYADVTYTDGTELWGLASEFRTGDHSWEKAEVFIEPAKPIKSIKVYALFRNHTGQVWFSDLSLSTVSAPNGAALFDTLAVRLEPAKAAPAATATTYRTQDGLALSVQPGGGQVTSLQIGNRELAAGNTPGGFLVRDVANDSGFYRFENGVSNELQLALDTKIESAANYVAFSGSLSDKTGKDRAVSLAFALPIDARGWKWNKDIRSSQTIEGGEYSTTASFFAGANGRLSTYPLASIGNAESGLALALDMNHAAQFRIAYNGATKQFYIIYDFGLAPEKNTAEFRFVLYRTDPQWGFRSATAKLQQIFPAMFEVRQAARKQGLWMPFTDISKVQGWQDFGFRFREGESSVAGDQSLAFDDKNDILTFRYSEPMTWWMPMAAAEPRSYRNAVAILQRIARDPDDKLHLNAQAVLSSGMRDEGGRYAVKFLDMPWANGAVWSLNASPDLRGISTGASLLWNPDIRKRTYEESSVGTVDGEYLDSLEGYVTANLDFDRDHFRKAGTPLTFSSGSRVPAQHKALLAYEATRWMSHDLHAMNKLLMANSVPYRFSFLTPWLDVMGTEADWMPGGQWRPDDDSLMNLRRTMAGAKPYLLLQNTNYKNFTSSWVEKYMQRSLFYGIFPGFFSADAATDPYWLNPPLYNRDRNLFKKYIPVIKQVAEAGWQPITLATSDNPSVWVERFGSGSIQYLTVRNDAATKLASALRLSGETKKLTVATNLFSGKKMRFTDGAIVLNLEPGETIALELR